MNNYRIYVEKYPEFQVEARSLLSELNENLQLELGALRLLNVYDLFGFSQELLEKSRYSVFGEIVTDSVTDECDLSDAKYIAVEYLPGQFDQRAASAVDCVRLIDPSAQVSIKSSKLIILPEDTSDEVIAKIKKYFGIGIKKAAKGSLRETDIQLSIGKLRTMENAQYYITGYKELIENVAKKLGDAPESMTTMEKAKIVRMFMVIYAGYFYFIEDCTYRYLH